MPDVAASPDPHPGLVEVTSASAFEPTHEHIVTTIEAAGLQIFARIDHAANAASVGLSMTPTIVLVYGNARGGTPIMVATPRAALDLPLRVLIREDADGSTRIAFHPVSAMLVAAGVPAAMVAHLEPAQALLLRAIVR